MREASESTDRLRESSKTPGWSGAAEIRKWRDRHQRSKSLEKTKEREAAELSTICGMGAQHKEKILEGIRELEQEHDREAQN
jgi:DNA polymerase/3'-5' exonuclease PolX